LVIGVANKPRFDSASKAALQTVSQAVSESAWQANWKTGKVGLSYVCIARGWPSLSMAKRCLYQTMTFHLVCCAQKLHFLNSRSVIYERTDEANNEYTPDALSNKKDLHEYSCPRSRT